MKWMVRNSVRYPQSLLLTSGLVLRLQEIIEPIMPAVWTVIKTISQGTGLSLVVIQG